MQRGTVVIVSFPFTDLSATKKRPALVVSPEGFHADDVIVCAITSQVPAQLGTWDVSLNARDLALESLPKPSIIKVGKLFTMHPLLIAGEFGVLKDRKLTEVLDRIRGLFA